MNPLIGRQETIIAVIDNIALKRHTLLFGSVGCGKTEILKSLSSTFNNSVYVERLVPLKESLLNMAQALDINLDKNHTVTSLKELILKNCHGRIIFLDHLECVTASASHFLVSLAECALIVAATNKDRYPDSLNRLYMKFYRVEVKNLDKENSKKLLWHELGETKVKDRKAVENAVYLKTCGNPLLIKDLARLIKDRGYDFEMPELEKRGGGARELDLTPILLFIGAIVISARFVALGLDDIDTYILAGTFGAFFVFLRYFIYRSMRKR